MSKVLKRAGDKVVADQTKGAYISMAEDLFEDYYAHRGQVYKMNFVRGIFFGVGSVLGGTIIVALLLWILSAFVQLPVIGQFFQNAQHTVEQKR
ncbi:MAG TPA: DUF5665 domain-containing protein [Candidatus Saccharimonadales bacterium]|jgi:hypothetical protein|nr:DUF5665 domain-containing protein [Candidatus Saccharimonadales bacterium]